MIVNLVYRINGGQDLSGGWSEAMGERGSRCFIFRGWKGELGQAAYWRIPCLPARTAPDEVVAGRSGDFNVAITA